MQKIRFFFSFLVLFVLIFGIFSPITLSFSLDNIYDYRDYYQEVNIYSRTSENFSSFEKELHFESPRTTFFLIFPEYKHIPPPDDLYVEWIVDGTSHIRTLDLEDPGEHVSTFPLVVKKRKTILVRIYSKNLPKRFIVSTARHDPVARRITISPGAFLSSASSAYSIVTRKQWGADETLRYVSQHEQERRVLAWKERGESPRIIEITQEEQDKRIQSMKQLRDILSNDPDAMSVISIRRYENGNKLIWPIQKTKKMNSIVIHHTAESLDKVADDETFLRAIYSYHARTKGWGDIGYHYIVGQRGKIYEGRAGGDYVEGAHVYGNNYGSVGIGVIGNYDQFFINRDQKAGLINAITYVAQKYGIDVSETLSRAYPCGGSDCFWKPVTTRRLLGHRDLGNTSCPGKNLYDIIPELGDIVAGNVGKVSPIYNTEQSVIEEIPPEDRIEYRIKDTKNTINNQGYSLKSSIKSSGGKPIKIRLSYPNHDIITLRNAGIRNPRVFIDNKKLVIKKGSIVSVRKVGNSNISVQIDDTLYSGKEFSIQSDLIEIPSWSRKPSWDTRNQYNDNLFRSKIIVRNIDNNFLIVNQLPIEDYLKGLGEVSNGDYEEKIKAIIVAARGYAYYYINPQHRKYKTLLYDGSDDPNEFQRYLGYGYELRSPRVLKMVEETRGEVITYNGEIIKPWYFSSSDGRTLSYKEYCEANTKGICKDIPYLQSVDDPAGIGKTRNGHGVGISGIGATYGASIGKSYKEIITYYLKGVQIENIQSLKK